MAPAINARVPKRLQDLLPDRYFAYVAPGGEHDKPGFTKPRSSRALLLTDARGKWDWGHIRDAAAGSAARSNRSGTCGMKCTPTPSWPERRRALVIELRKSVFSIDEIAMRVHCTRRRIFPDFGDADASRALRRGASRRVREVRTRKVKWRI
jgi:hypothetical protein